jgi:hypothetical protein
MLDKEVFPVQRSRLHGVYEQCGGEMVSYSPPPRIIASVYVLGIGAGTNPGCLGSEKVPFKLAVATARAESLLESFTCTLGLIHRPIFALCEMAD